MGLPNKLSEQIAFNTSWKIEEHILVVMNKSVHEEHLSQRLQTNKKQFKTAVTFLTGYNGIFKVTSSNVKFYFKITITDEDGFIQITIPPGVYEIESLNKEIKQIIFDEGHYNEANYPSTKKPNFLALGSIIENLPQGPIMSEDSVRDILRFNAMTLYEE